MAASLPLNQGHPHRWAILVVLCAGPLLVVIDSSVVSVALPAIAEAFTASTATLQAVMDAYIVVFAGTLIAGGVVADRAGRRRAVIDGLVILGAASAAAPAAPSVWWLVGIRMLMGAGAALVVPATLATLTALFPQAERAKAFAVWAAIAAGALAAGPVLGGLLIAVWDWPAVFLINVPVAAFAAVAISRVVPETRDPQPGPVDPLSTALVTAGLAAAALTFIGLGSASAWGRACPLSGAVAAAALAAFGWRQRRAAHPMVDFALYRDRAFSGGSASAAVLTLGTGSTVFVLSQYLQLVVGYSAWQSGLVLAPLAVGVAAGSAAGARSATTVGARRSIVTGFVVVTAGFGCLAALPLFGGRPGLPLATLLTGLILLGLGVGFAAPSVTTTVLGAVPPGRTGMGAALNSTHQQLGTALGVAGLGSVLAVVYRAGLPAAIPRDDATSLAATLTRVRGMATAPALAHQARAAFAVAQSVTMLAAAAAALAAASIAAVLLPRHVGRPARATGHRETGRHEKGGRSLTTSRADTGAAANTTEPIA